MYTHTYIERTCFIVAFFNIILYLFLSNYLSTYLPSYLPTAYLNFWKMNLLDRARAHARGRTSGRERTLFPQKWDVFCNASKVSYPRSELQYIIPDILQEFMIHLSTAYLYRSFYVSENMPALYNTFRIIPSFLLFLSISISFSPFLLSFLFRNWTH